MEMTSLIESPPVSMSSSSGPTYDNVHPGSSSHDQVNVIGIYAQKNKTLETEVKNLQKELTKAKDMLKNVEKYWSQQVSTYFLHTLIYQINAQRGKILEKMINVHTLGQIAF